MMLSQKLNSHKIFKQLAKALISLRVCAGWSEPLLVVHTTLLEISCHCSFHKHKSCGVISHLILYMLDYFSCFSYSLLTFFKIIFLRKFLSGTLAEYQRIWIKIKIWIYTVFKRGYIGFWKSMLTVLLLCGIWSTGFCVYTVFKWEDKENFTE